MQTQTDSVSSLPRVTKLLFKFDYPSMAAFAKVFSKHVSPLGMFVRARTPLPIGKRVRFEIQYGEGRVALRGTGIVRWTREPGSGPHVPGMGISFEYLDAPSRQFVEACLRASHRDDDVQIEIAY